MADNTVLDPGAAGDTIATDDIAGVKYPRSKIVIGADGTNDGDVSSANPLPVTGTITAVTSITNDVSIADGGNSITVDNGGTFAVQAAQTGTWNVTNVSGTISLPTGAATAAKQPALGTAGTASADVITVQGIASMTALVVDGSAVTQPVSGTIDTVTNLAQMGGVAISLNTGVRDTGTQRVTIATDDVVPVTNAGLTELAAAINTSRLDINLDATPAANLVTVAGAVSGTEMQVDVVAALPAGTNAIGKLAANSGVDIGDVDVTSIAAGTNLIGDVGIQGRTTGGLSIYYDNDLDETAVAVKAGAGTLYSLHVINTTAAPLYLQLFNVAQGSVTVGTTTPTVQFVIPGNADSDGAGFTLSIPQGIAFGTAITAACSTGSETNGAPGANACHCNLFYK